MRTECTRTHTCRGVMPYFDLSSLPCRWSAWAYISTVIARVPLPLILVAATVLRADELKPETVAGFDHYVKLTEEAMQARSTPGNFLWLDKHPKKKDMVWLGQSFVMPLETPDHGKKMDVPDGSIQHWLGAIYL